MPQSQDEIFVAFEGDNWFQRNQEALKSFDFDSDLVMRVMDLYHLCPRSVAEVGAANGFRLAAIADRCGAEVVGIEPSLKALKDGKRQFPHVQLLQGTASSIPLERRFDLVIVNFVLHWIDRHNLLRSVAEIDRIVADGGFLLIGDFYPANRTKVPYHHLTKEEVYTFKQHYSAIFTASGVYQSVAVLSGDHATKRLDATVPQNDVVAAWLLRKRLQDLYLESSFKH